MIHVRTHASEVVLSSGSPWVFSESASEIPMQILNETTIGKAYFSVETAGVMCILLLVPVERCGAAYQPCQPEPRLAPIRPIRSRSAVEGAWHDTALEFFGILRAGLPLHRGKDPISVAWTSQMVAHGMRRPESQAAQARTVRSRA